MVSDREIQWPGLIDACQTVADHNGHSLTCLFFGGAFAVQAWTYFENFGGRGADKRPVQFLVAVLLFFSLLSDAVLIHRIFDVHGESLPTDCRGTETGALILVVCLVPRSVASSEKLWRFRFPFAHNWLGADHQLYLVSRSHRRLIPNTEAHRWAEQPLHCSIAFMASSVQLYFAHRVWTAYGKSLFVALPFGVSISYTFAGGIASGVLSLKSGSAANVRGSALHSFQPNSTPWQWSAVFASWLISSATVDVALCVLLALQLSKVKSREYRLGLHIFPIEYIAEKGCSSAPFSIFFDSPCCGSIANPVRRDVCAHRCILSGSHESLLGKTGAVLFLDSPCPSRTNYGSELHRHLDVPSFHCQRVGTGPDPGRWLTTNRSVR